jgi:HSP20 family protein
MTQERTSLRRSMEQLLQDTLRIPALPPVRLAADVYETVDGDAYAVEIPVPGLDASAITIEATPDQLTVSTHPTEPASHSDRKYLQQEQQQGPMSRVFEFPSEIDPDHISANLEAGMLKIHAPKAAATRPRVIKLQKQD